MRDDCRVASMKTNRREDGQFDVLFTGTDGTKFHFFAEPLAGDRYKLGGILTDRGEKPEPSARTRSSTEGPTGRLGRIRLRQEDGKCDFVLTHQGSALTASEVEVLDPTTHKAVELPGDGSEEETIAVDYRLEKPEEPDDAVAVQASTGSPEIWFQFRPISSSSGTV